MKKKPRKSAISGAEIARQFDIPECPAVAGGEDVDRERLDGNTARRRSSSSSIEWDTELPGFGLRIRPTGHRSWVVKYQERGQQRFVTLGPANNLQANDARKQARKLLERAALAGLAVRASKAVRLSPTLPEYLPEFWRDYGVHWKPSLRLGGQFDRHEPGHRAAEQLLTPGVELTGPDPVLTRDHGHDGTRLRGFLQDRQLLFVAPVPAPFHSNDRSAISACAHMRLV
jgi:hypothetical protein